jgi:hypothetical protein
LRQTGTQAIPGTLGWSLEPAPAAYIPGVPPDEARRFIVEDGSSRLAITLAVARDTLGARDMPPAWILIQRGVCYPSAKGEVVSDARGSDENDLGCNDSNLWIVAIDARSGDRLFSLTGYDPTGTWAPNVGEYRAE